MTMKKGWYYAAVPAILFATLLCFRHHLYYIEQFQLFIWDREYLLSGLGAPSGFSAIFSDFLTQFYRFPVAGPLIHAALLTLVTALTAAVVKKVCGNDSFLILSLLPAAFALADILDTDFRHSGLIAMILMLTALLLIENIKDGKKRFIVSIMAVAAVFWLAGSYSLILSLALLVCETRNGLKASAKYLLPLLMVPVLAWGCDSAGLVPSFKDILLPHNYLPFLADIPVILWLSWISVPLTILVARLVPENLMGKPGSVSMVLQGCAVLAIAVLALTGMDRGRYVFEAADTMARNKDWDKILKLYKNNPDSRSVALMKLVNLALAEKGGLGEDLFEYSQSGSECVIPSQELDMVSTGVGSELYWSMGLPGLSQRMAFEQDMYAFGIHNPRALQRLVRTNLVYGEYAVAEKYISLLEKSPAYRHWAKKQRLLLGDDAAMADEELADLRRCLPDTTSLGEIDGLEMDLRMVAKTNPAHRQAIQYLEALFLLDKDMGSTMAMVEEFYGTEVLPKLPKPLQEAVAIVANSNGMNWQMTKYSVSNEVRKNYRKFNAVLQKGSGQSEFEDTFWYYAFFINTDGNENQ